MIVWTEPSWTVRAHFGLTSWRGYNVTRLVSGMACWPTTRGRCLTWNTRLRGFADLHRQLRRNSREGGSPFE
ncbi:hypothetical protein [Kibdelosporangium philippinense]|uniref:hypothetical protein n=1 Tax=Kibdelosporangium philippinense TaxID=211113 RepID=UPI0036155569